MTDSSNMETRGGEIALKCLNGTMNWKSEPHRQEERNHEGEELKRRGGEDGEEASFDEIHVLATNDKNYVGQ